MMVHITPDHGMLRDIRNNRLYSEVVVDERKARFFVLAESGEDPETETLEGITLTERVSDLEDAVVELAEIITEVTG